MNLTFTPAVLFTDNKNCHSPAFVKKCFVFHFIILHAEDIMSLILTSA